MKVQVQFDCPIGVVVDTETGKIDSVHVWDQSVDFTAPTKAYRDEYLRDGDAEFERALALHIECSNAQAKARGVGLGDDRSYSDIARRYGVSLFEELPLDDPNVAKAREVITADDEMWPGWEFGP